ncbi:DUF4056 domain-containing protein [Solimonas terrae]|uniref:DUF4056 domain-containing protein n=1 Tax=Solimonas terrae TaxID=1396819 RepID=UPI0019D53485|nr:DUF4056 domain-containing protein [Solimonas terrae]
MSELVAPTAVARDSFTVAPPLRQPDSLRPCCAFGHGLRVRALGIPVPLVRLDNVIDPTLLGNHGYNGGTTGFLGDLLGSDAEKLGIVYTRRGGFVDIAHVRDSADNALFLFSQIWPRLGQRWTLDMGPELADRRLVFEAFDLPARAADRYTLAAFLAAHLSFQLAAWHEIAQWHGYHTVPGFSEEISAFSPEDLYSNVLGARLGLIIELQGEASSRQQFSASLTRMLPQALNALQSVSPAETRENFDKLDGCWWDSEARVPDKFAVLYRSYDISGVRRPLQPDFETLPPQDLEVPYSWNATPLARYAQLRLYATDQDDALPPPPASGYWTPADFQALADAAARADALSLLARSVASADPTRAYVPPSTELCHRRPSTGRRRLQ